MFPNFLYCCSILETFTNGAQLNWNEKTSAWNKSLFVLEIARKIVCQRILYMTHTHNVSRKKLCHTIKSCISCSLIWMLNGIPYDTYNICNGIERTFYISTKSYGESITIESIHRPPQLLTSTTYWTQQMRCTKNRSEKLTVRLHSQIHAFISFAFIIPLVCIFFFKNTNWIRVKSMFPINERHAHELIVFSI